ncbi:Pr6Pr family membrane protein [Georgenia sp. Z1491]|uniref:Pr6Pr family membrane protein n=1 Tax=Georgenia sp. Z1491 TaxID=3416707 RepID=UPI003CF4A60B
MTHPHDEDDIDPTVAVPGSMAAQVRASRGGSSGRPPAGTGSRPVSEDPARTEAMAPVAPEPRPGGAARFDSAATPQDPEARVTTAELPALSEPAPGPGWGPAAAVPPPGRGHAPGPPYAPGPGHAPGSPYGPGAPHAAGRPPSGAVPYRGPQSLGGRRGLPPANGGVVAISVLWRLAVAAVAIWAVYELLVPTYEVGGWPGLLDQLSFFTTVSTILVALVMAASVLRALSPGSARHRLEGRHGWFRGLVTTYSVMTAVIFVGVLEGSLEDRLSLVVHLVLPAAMVLDWLVVGRNQDRVPGFWPVLWVLPMFGYLAVYMWQSDRLGYPLYPFLDPGASDFLRTAAMLLGAWLVCGFLVWGIGRLRGAALGR